MERTKGFVEKVQWLNLKGTFTNALDALTFLKTNPIELLFLDIQMDELSGIELLKSLQSSPQVILTTAHDQYALESYDLNVTDYLLKPFTFDRFLKAVDKVALSSSNSQEQREFLFVKTENRLERINWDDILFIEGMRDYRRIHTISKKIMTLQTFSEFEKVFPREIVCRVHKSYMVAIKQIDALERNRIRIQEAYIPISESYKKDFFAVIQAG